MKRSGQVALVLMGVTAATAAGAYMMPSRPECQAPQPRRCATSRISASPRYSNSRAAAHPVRRALVAGIGAIWGVVALIVQVIAYYIARIPLPDLSHRIAEGELGLPRSGSAAPRSPPA